MTAAAALSGAKVFITGGLGFIGSNLAMAAAARGAQVTVLDALLPQYGGNPANLEGAARPIRVEIGDVRNRPLVLKLADGADMIFDCASQVSHARSVREPFTDVDINCNGALSVLEAARQGAPKARLVYASTRGVVGRTVYSPIDEAHPTEPTDLNGIDKLAAEKYYRLYGELYGLWTASLRISNTFGPRAQMRHDDYGVVNWFLRRAMRHETIVIHGDGKQLRDYNHVDDVVRAFFLAATVSEARGQQFLLGRGQGTSLITMIETILDIVGWKHEITRIPRPPERQAIEIGDYVVSIEKARRLLGWAPEIGLREGLQQTHDWYAQGGRLEKYL